MSVGDGPKSVRCRADVGTLSGRRRYVVGIGVGPSAVRSAAIPQSATITFAQSLLRGGKTRNELRTIN